MIIKLGYSFVGYQAQDVDVTIGTGESVKLDVQLQLLTETLNEVEIVANKRDLGKEVMSNVRNARRDYLKALESYTCETYIKTSLEKMLVRPTSKDFFG